MASMEQHLLTSPQAAQRLGVARWTVNRWAKAGRLAYVCQLPGLTGAFLFDAKEIDALAQMRAEDDAL